MALDTAKWKKSEVTIEAIRKLIDRLSDNDAYRIMRVRYPLMDDKLIWEYISLAKTNVYHCMLNAREISVMTPKTGKPFKDYTKKHRGTFGIWRAVRNFFQLIAQKLGLA